jgi:hypothetical protein
MSTPYIDFHFNGSRRLYRPHYPGPAKQCKYSGQCQLVSYRWQFNRWLNNARQYRSRPAGHRRTCAVSDAGRGANGDPDGAYVQMYMEEKVGTEHRIVLYLTVSEEPMHGIPRRAAQSPPAKATS